MAGDEPEVVEQFQGILVCGNHERKSMKHEAITASPNSGVNTLSGEGLAEVSTITEHEAAQVQRANASGATPIVFVHGLWLLPSSWDRG
jgi:hypothetical protein